MTINKLLTQPPALEPGNVRQLCFNSDSTLIFFVACSICPHCIMVKCQVKPSYIDLLFSGLCHDDSISSLPYIDFFVGFVVLLIYNVFFWENALWWVVRWSRIQACLSPVYFITIPFPLHQFLCISCYLILLFTIINDEDTLALMICRKAFKCERLCGVHFMIYHTWHQAANR